MSHNNRDNPSAEKTTEQQEWNSDCLAPDFCWGWCDRLSHYLRNSADLSHQDRQICD